MSGQKKQMVIGQPVEITGAEACEAEVLSVRRDGMVDLWVRGVGEVTVPLASITQRDHGESTRYDFDPLLTA